LAYRLLHFADLHLDRSFAGERLHGVGAQRRREDLRAALSRILDRAREAKCDLITCAGDLFEQDHITRETTSFVADALGSAGRPVLIAPGHSDPAVPSSPYRYLRWPGNVTIASHDSLQPYRFGPLTVWAAAANALEPSVAPLRDFERIEGGINLLLLHASDMNALPEGVTPLAPIVAGQVQDCGFGHALLGHYHQGRRGPWMTYPGSPEPLGWRETGPHCVAMVSVDDQGMIEVTLEPVNQRRFAEVEVDVTGMTTRDQVREAMVGLRAGSELEGAVVRARLTGERAHTIDLDLEGLAVECGDGFANLDFRDETRTAHDLEALVQEFTSRGEFVRRLRERESGQETAGAAGRAIQLTLDAFDA
jgi:DNA repair exonuclease SbcCD nuclease subunit